ncbi:MAG: hypothetical protein M1837_002018 [Sclerophora amabilis]|nr:MAG: hypothetical protein M1837_002018 [Sclerophora amabilis]
MIQELYQNDMIVETKPNYIVFNAGEHPRLPFEGHKFLRFSSKTSGNRAKGVEEYIDTVTQVAKCWFGSRVRYWNEARDNLGFYDWEEVHDSVKSYEQPDGPEIPTCMARYGFGTDVASELNLQLFGIESVPGKGKGKGLVARANIAKGTRILFEKPLFTTPNSSQTSLMESAIAKKLKALSKTDCFPNAHNSWNSDTKCETIHAVRDLKSGEEVTISYDEGGSSDSRRTHLRDAFGFDCHCSLCSLSLPDLEISDARRLRIQRLDDAIGDPARVLNNPSDALTDCHRLFQVIEEEYEGSATSLVARLYYDAFQISITHGDQARASVFAERGYKTRVLCEGEDSPETQTIKNLMENPTEHRNFEVSKRWKTAKRLVPKGLDTDEFEKWLWRQGR